MLGRTLVLAPHLIYPLRNGGDLLIDRKWSMFSNHAGCVDILGMNVMRKYQDGQVVEEVRFGNKNRSKHIAALRTVIRNSHYLLEKYITPEYIEEACRTLVNEQYDVLVCSLITTAWAIKRMTIILPDKMLIETQNDEIKWYQNMRIQSRSLPEKISALISEQWVKNNLSKLKDCIFLHVSEDDDSGYRKILPEHKSIVIPVGTDEEDLNFDINTEVNKDNIILIFSGSLATKINYDALSYFENKFYPTIKSKFRHRLKIIVVGSNPSEGIRTICKKNDWALHEDVSDDKLRELYHQSLFSILPFSYANGGKLKLLKSLSFGIPFLASSVLSGQMENIPPSCLISDDPEIWSNQIEIVLKSGLSIETRNLLIESANKYSWRRLANIMYEELNKIYF